MTTVTESRGEYNREQVELIKKTVAPGVSDDELALFMHACRVTGLDPLTRQIYAIKRKAQDDQGNLVDRMTVQTGIDGYRLIADRTGRYAPGPEPRFEYDTDTRLVSATAFVRKRTEDGTWHTVAATAHWSEYAATKRDGQPTKMWHTKPHIMLAKCAEALALRRAFPAELSAVYTREEMDQAGNEAPQLSAQPQQALPPPTEQPRPADPIEAELIGADEVQALEEMCDTRGKTREGCMTWLGLPTETSFEDLDVSQYRKLRAVLDKASRKTSPRRT